MDPKGSSGMGFLIKDLFGKLGDKVLGLKQRRDILSRWAAERKKKSCERLLGLNLHVLHVLRYNNGPVIINYKLVCY